MADEAPNWGKLAEMDPVLDGMMHAGTPLTRENYIRENWGDTPQPWTAEHEAELPAPFQRTATG